MNNLYRFFWDCSWGEVEGVFIASHDELETVIGKEVYFGEILGKHSEVYGTVERDDVELISDDQDFIYKLEEVFKGKTVSGYNPIDYYEQQWRD